ncbi:hypothetical protein QA601_01815 [Chitinispirillales bacterium ANBcel5]|uniref:hypothetical protein n=1 Tax=Cellulosispirillum alkaliphilum TaxID=3039283 RepID=UPI002A54669D|nr:hypothetical protein [Chitinispirillales bacterium ANBcel5]
MNTYTKKDIVEMKELFIMRSNGHRSLFPVIVGIDKQVENIFAVPEKDAIGTIDIDNAISFLEFVNDKVKIRIIKKNFAEEVSGEYDFFFTPVYSDTDITYAQSRWLINQNLRTKENRTVFVINNLDDWIGNLAVLNAEKGIFVIEVLKGWAKGSGRAYKKFLNIGTLENEDFIPIAVVEGGLYDGLPGSIYASDYSPWAVKDGILFVFDEDSKTVKAFNENGITVDHPFSGIFNRNHKKLRKVREISFHPELPFGLVVDAGEVPDIRELQEQRNNGLISMAQYRELLKPLTEESLRHAIWLVRWDTDDENRQFVPLMSLAGNLIPFIDDVKMCSDFQFSPDGTWLVFRDNTQTVENPVFVSIPVSPDKPLFFGEPLYLGQVLREGMMVGAKGSAWIDKPTSFVVTDGQALYKWELGNIDKSRVINQ